MTTLQEIEDILTGWDINSPRLSALLAAGEGGADALLVSAGTGGHSIQPAEKVGAAYLTKGDPALSFTGYLGGQVLSGIEELARDLGELLGLPVVVA